jgi:hypothetical protein
MSAIESGALDLALLALLIALLVGLWRAYMPMVRQARRDAAGLRAAVAAQHARYNAETEFLNRQARRVECPVCGAERGEDCHGRIPALQRLAGPHHGRVTAYREAIH